MGVMFARTTLPATPTNAIACLIDDKPKFTMTWATFVRAKVQPCPSLDAVQARTTRTTWMNATMGPTIAQLFIVDLTIVGSSRRAYDHGPIFIQLSLNSFGMAFNSAAFA